VRQKFIALTLTTALTIFTASSVDARTLVGVTDWIVSDAKVAQGPTYCTMARKYQENSTITFAKNAKGEGTIAFDFERDVFNAAKAYAITLNSGGVKRQYTIKPVSNSVVIMRTSTDASLFQAMQTTGALDVTIEGQAFTINLDGYGSALANLNECVGSDSATSVVVERTMPRPPKTNQVQEQELLAAQNTRVESLMEDNINLVQTLESEREDFRNRLATEQSTQPVSANADAVLVQKLVDAEKRNTQLLRQISTLETQLQSKQAAVNPDISSALRSSETRLELLEGEKKRLQAMLDEERSKRVALEAEIVALKTRGVSSGDLADGGALANELNAQIASLQQQNTDLKNRLESVQNQEPQVIVKEVIKEVPVMNAGTSADMAEQLAEAETSALSLKAERDEYRSLLQRERQRLKDAGDIGQQINTANAGADSMVETVRQLEAEKVDLIRQLEFAKTNGASTSNIASNNTANDALKNRLNEVMQESEKAKQSLRILSDDKKALEQQLAKAEADIIAARQASVGNRVSQIASTDATMDAELRSLQAEISALEAQNLILREDMAANKNRTAVDSGASDRMLAELEQKYKGRFQAIERENIRLANALNKEQNKQPEIVEARMPRQPQIVGKLPDVVDAVSVPVVPVKTVSASDNVGAGSVSPSMARQALRNKITGRTIAPSPITETTPVANAPSMKAVPIAVAARTPMAASTHIQSVKMAELSGDEIKRLVAQSNIPLVSPINRVSNVSGPDFAAFRWDTGTVFGSAEQTKLSNPAAFEKSVSQYISKTQSRCVGDFDKTLLPVTTSNGLNARAVDIACVQNGDSGAAVSVLFFENNGMFYAVAHESGLDHFETAMQLRDQMANNLNRLF